MKKYDYFIHMEKLFDKIDKLFQKEFGKQCRDFAPLCPSCEFYLIYNKFKQDIFERFVKNNKEEKC